MTFTETQEQLTEDVSDYLINQNAKIIKFEDLEI